MEADSSAAAAATAASPLAGPQGQWATQFVRVALKTSFGPIVELVGDSLMSRGPQSLDELYRHTRLDVATLKKALLTLIQQDIVQPAYERVIIHRGAGAAKAKKARAPRVVYSLQPDSLRQRARHAHYLLWTKNGFGPYCEYIMQTLLVHGKLTSAQVVDLTSTSILETTRLKQQAVWRQQVQDAVAAAAAAGQTAVKPPPPAPLPPYSAAERKNIHDLFKQLIASRYIRRAQGLAPPEDALVVGDGASADSGSAAGAAAAPASSAVNVDILQTFLANQKEAQQKAEAQRSEAAAVAAASDAQAALRAATAAAVAAEKPGRKRKKVVLDDEEGEGEGAAAAAEGGEGAAASSKPPAKRAKKKTKKELEAEAAELKLAEAVAARAKAELEQTASLERAGAGAAGESSGDWSGDSDGHVVWCVNHAQFLWEFRKKAAVDYVSQQHSPACAFVVEQLLNQYPADCCDAAGGDRPAVYDVDQIVSLCAAGAQSQSSVNPVGSSELVEECLHELLGDPSLFLERKSHPRGYLINLRALFAAVRLAHVQAVCRARYGPLSARIFRCLLQHKRLEETQLAELATAPRKEVRRLLYTMLDAHLVAVQEVPRTADRLPQKTFYLWGIDVARVQAHFLDSLYFSWCNLRTRGEMENEQAKPVLDKVDTSKVITHAERDRVEQWKKGADRIELGLHQINQLIMLFHDF